MRTLTLLTAIVLFGCTSSDAPNAAIDAASCTAKDYLDYSERDDLTTAGIKMIPIETEKGTFKVWTKRIGNNPDMKLLLLHGGPGMTHEYLESFDSFMPGAEIEYYYYDQLDSYRSDQPNDSSLWTVDRFVDEVEQVRTALGLDSTNFYLYGSSWGGILAMEYALKYQENLKGLIISNMMASIDDYNRYAEEVLGPQLPPDVLAEIVGYEKAGDYGNPRYLELINEHFYPDHVMHKPLEEWPEPVNRSFKHGNFDLYVKMQGPSEFGIKGNARLLGWDVKHQLHTLTVPTLSIGATHDTMDPEHMKWIASEVQNGEFLLCPNGAHLCMWDDQEHFFPGLISFMKRVNGQ